jgi:phosphoribosylanthranilate isomerase
VQIYTMQSAEEAVAVARVGVDHVGVTPSDRGLPGEVSVETASEICRAVEGFAVSCISVDRPAPSARAT